MRKVLLVGAAFVFAGIAATVAGAADHKSKPAAAPVVAASKADAKGPGHHKKHHAAKKAHHAHRAAHHAK